MYVKFYREILITLLFLLVAIPLAWYLYKTFAVKHLSSRVAKFRKKLQIGDQCYFQSFIKYSNHTMEYAFIKCKVIDQLSETTFLIHFKEPGKKFPKSITKHVTSIMLFPRYAIDASKKIK